MKAEPSGVTITLTTCESEQLVEAIDNVDDNLETPIPSILNVLRSTLKALVRK